MKEFIEELYQPNEITKDLVTNEDEINKVKESDKTNWDYVFTDEADKKVKYRMRDVDTPATYETAVDYYDPTTIQIETEITGQKKWVADTVEDRPDFITVYLLANGEKLDEQRVTARVNWTYRFTNVPVYDAMGEKISYAVKEKAVVGYKTIYEKYNIINSRVESNEGANNEEGLAASRATRIGLFILGAAAITAGLLFDQARKED